MKWIGISGGWRDTSKQVEKDVRRIVKEIIQRGDGIVTGGALNVDAFALDEVLKHDSKAKQVKVFIPTRLKIYANHYRKRAGERVISSEQAENLISQLSNLKKIKTQALIENKENTKVNKETYYQRNLEVIKNSDEIIAFQINNSAGTQDIINKAKNKNIPVKIFSYSI